MDLRMKIGGRGSYIKPSAMERLSKYSTQPDISKEHRTSSPYPSQPSSNAEHTQETNNDKLVTPVSRLKPQYQITVKSSNPGVDGRLTTERMIAHNASFQNSSAQERLNHSSIHKHNQSQNMSQSSFSTPHDESEAQNVLSKSFNTRCSSNLSHISDNFDCLSQSSECFDSVSSPKKSELSGRFSSLSHASNLSLSSNLNVSLNSLTISVNEGRRSVTPHVTMNTSQNSPINTSNSPINRSNTIYNYRESNKYDSNNNRRSLTENRRRSSGGLSDVSSVSKSPSPNKESLVEKTANCICHRPKAHILCTICGYSTFGHVRQPCYAHLRVTYLLAMACCPRCNSGRLMEVAPLEPTD